MATDHNIYKDDVDFAVLALQSPAFNKYLKPNGQLDFSNPEAVQQLTKSLLKRDFDLEIELPDDRLCPPVPNRLNYILWIQDLLDTTDEDYSDLYNADRDVVGLDIGTGASCIYPLLGCSQRPRWRFAVTDIDEKNMHYAKQNVLRNSMKSRIRPLQTKSTDPLIPLEPLRLESIDFTICNPPFYASTTELLASADAKSRPPHSACTGADVEMVTPGGEIAFVNRMIEESVALKTRCQWYTSMLGKLSSVGTVVEKLKEVGIENFAVREFVQGGKTRRWAIAWSWGVMRPRQDVARGISSLPKHLMPFPSEFQFAIPNASLEDVARRLNATLEDLDLQWQYRPSQATGLGFAKANVWSRAARRQQQRGSTAGSKSAALGKDDEPSLGFKIYLQMRGELQETQVSVRWLKGHDSVLFESFCGMLKRQISSL